VGTAYLSLGSNQDALAHLARARRELAARFPGARFSPLYRTPAVGFDGADFLNAAAVVDSELDIVALDAWLHALEDAHGRRRDVPRFSDRPLDVDIVFYDDLVFRGPGNLQVPRPELQHAFVLRPLAELAPTYRDPASGHSLAQLWAAHPERHAALAEVAWPEP
jgi:2-amino-4-hydroxy-6-hydroxymethyldihydropteridine diphosphokinase